MKEKRKLVYWTMSSQEYEDVVKEYEKSTDRSMSAYIRKRLSGTPVTVYYRNKSFDEFVNEAILLRQALEGISSKVSLSVENEEKLIELTHEIKEKINKLFDNVSKDKNKERPRPDFGV